MGRGLQPEDAVAVFARSCGSVCNKPPTHNRPNSGQPLGGKHTLQRLAAAGPGRGRGTTRENGCLMVCTHSVTSALLVRPGGGTWTADREHRGHWTSRKSSRTIRQIFVVVFFLCTGQGLRARRATCGEGLQEKGEECEDRERAPAPPSSQFNEQIMSTPCSIGTPALAAPLTTTMRERTSLVLNPKP